MLSGVGAGTLALFLSRYFALPGLCTMIFGRLKGKIMLTTDEDILTAAQDWRAKGRNVAIATVVETWGSAPRPVGSHLVIDGEGNFLGSVSGGCVEGEVVTEALDVIAEGAPKMLEFGVADETAWRAGLSCGGRIKVYVERLD
jgi:xanthine/CO dehydrogenase XdhC/CoxF family maturation factor